MAKGIKTGGRTAGTPNKVTADVKARCRELLEDDTYKASFLVRWQSNTLPPQLEQMVWHYAHGKPTEHVEHTGPGGGPIVVHDHFYGTTPPVPST